MGNIFGKPKSHSRVTEQDKAILQLKQQRDKLKQYQKRIEQNLEKDRLVAKQLVSEGKREKAMGLLKKKRFQENLIERSLGQLDNLEKLIHDIEFAQVESEVITGLKIGNDCLKKMHEILSIDDVQQVLDETKDVVEYQREIDQLISGASSDLWTPEDESSIQTELDDIINAQTSQLPSVPTDKLLVREKSPKSKESRQPEALLA